VAVRARLQTPLLVSRQWVQAVAAAVEDGAATLPPAADYVLRF
jgi:hypothetical protein